MGGYSEPAVRTDVQDTEAFKDVDLMLFDKVIAFDNFRQKIILIVNMSLEDPETGYNKAVLELKQLRELLRTGEQKQEEPGRLLGEVTPLFDRETYCGVVERAKRHIREGDIFQIVLSNRPGPPRERGRHDGGRVRAGARNPGARRVPGASGHLRGLRRDRDLRQKAYARQAVRDAV